MITISITTPASIIPTCYVTFISMVKVNIIVNSIVTVKVTVIFTYIITFSVTTTASIIATVYVTFVAMVKVINIVLAIVTVMSLSLSPTLPMTLSVSLKLTYRCQ